MTASLLVDLLGKVAWPVVAIVVLFGFRKSLLGLLERTRELEGPGDFKVKLDPTRVEQIVESGRRDNLSAKTITARIIDEAIVDEREFRILRALLGEREGRGMYSYQNAYYKPAIDELMKKEWIAHQDKKFVLTHEGSKIIAKKLRPLLESIEGVPG